LAPVDGEEESVVRVWGVVVLFLSACQVLNPPNTAATLQAEGRGYVETATAVQNGLYLQQTQVVATSDAASTLVADTQRINQQLLATVRAGATLEPRRSTDTTNVVVTPEGVEPGRRWFVKTGTSRSVRDSDGCVEQAEISFPVDTPRIYATVQAFNVESGVQMSAAWYYEGAEVLRESWTVPQSAADLCIWFDISPATVEFRTGSWSVQLFADGFQLEDPMTFSLVD
jgi:hypothetical protein